MSAEQSLPISKTHKLASLVCGRRTKWVILIFWVLVILLAGSFSSKLNSAESNDVSTWLPGKAESTQVLNTLSTFQSSNNVPGVVVYQRSSGLTAEDKTKIASDVTKMAGVEHVVRGSVKTVLAADGKAAQTVLMTDIGAGGWTMAPSIADDLHKIAATDGLEVHLAGPLGQAADSSKAFNGIDSTLLYAALGVVTVLLLITYRSPVLWLLPVISAGIALTCAQAIVYLLAKHVGLIVNGQSAGILTVLVFGAATDYALLLIARYREELHNHKDRHEAMALALHRAGPAIIASAATVAVGMLCLLAASLNSTHSLGPVTAIGITVGVTVMMTLLPALLVIFGRWLFWPIVPRFGTEVPTARGLWAKIGRGIAKKPRMVWIVTAVVLLVMSIGLVGLKANGLKTEDSYRNTPDSVMGERVLAQHFTAVGSGEPVVIIGTATAAADLHRTVQGTPGLTDVTPPAVKDGKVLIEATLTSAPDSDTAYNTIDGLRSRVHALPNANAKVGGSTAIILDSERASRRDSKVIIPLVLVVVFVILAILLRAFTAPLVLILTVVLSFAATLGACAQIFNHIFKFAGADTSLPLFVFVFLVALGIDYNIFLMTRVREEAKKGDTKKAALTGLAATGAVITSAGAVLAGTFAVLGTLPLTMFAEIGFAVAFGVLLDTLVVRSVLVTALTLDIGHKMWWPGKLWRTHKK